MLPLHTEKSLTFAVFLGEWPRQKPIAVRAACAVEAEGIAIADSPKCENASVQ